VVNVRSATSDACRLRALGIYEGARLTIVAVRPGLLVDVRGTRLAIGRALADTVDVSLSGALADEPRSSDLVRRSPPSPVPAALAD
jgi:Fe2+ transport system protein FeoA